VRDVRAALAAALPGYAVASVRSLGAGQDNVAYEVNGELVVRFRRAGPGRVVREAELLRLVAGVSPLPVPVPVAVDAARGWLAYRRLPGVPLLDRPPADPAAVGAVLGGFLAALHAVPVQRVAALVDVDDDPPETWRAETAETWRRVAGRVGAAGRRRVEGFLAAPAPPPAARLVLAHQDLGAEHVLADPTGADVTGVIDWSDAALGDPAYDLGLILRDLGPGALDAALPGHDPGTRARAWFYARCSAVEDLAYGVDTGRRRYTERALAALARLF
jgi:aminoglycoside phosphotransferase (APT) family kinase protein